MRTSDDKVRRPRPHLLDLNGGKGLIAVPIEKPLPAL
jgi:hypothetical protein